MLLRLGALGRVRTLDAVVLQVHQERVLRPKRFPAYGTAIEFLALMNELMVGQLRVVTETESTFRTFERFLATVKVRMYRQAAQSRETSAAHFAYVLTSFLLRCRTSLQRCFVVLQEYRIMSRDVIVEQCRVFEYVVANRTAVRRVAIMNSYVQIKDLERWKHLATLLAFYVADCIELLVQLLLAILVQADVFSEVTIGRKEVVANRAPLAGSEFIVLLAAVAL